MPSLRSRCIAALAAALATACVCFVKQGQNGVPSDFAMFWTAARVLADGGDPYAAIRPGGAWQWDSGYLYPLPGAMVLMPLVRLPAHLAVVVFTALSMGVLMFAVTRDDWQRWPMLMSAPALWAVTAGQWAPLVAAAAMTPAFAWAASVKPTLGLACFARRPSWRWLAVGAVLPVLGLALMPDWPLRWIDAATYGRAPGAYHVPLLVPFGVLLALAAVRWRDPDARLLLVMACVPQTVLVYDQLPLGVVARTRIQSYVFALWSYAVLVLAFLLRPEHDLDKTGTMRYLSGAITWGYYLPLLAVVLLRGPRATR